MITTNGTIIFVLLLLVLYLSIIYFRYHLKNKELTEKNKKLISDLNGLKEKNEINSRTIINESNTVKKLTHDLMKEKDDFLLLERNLNYITNRNKEKIKLLEQTIEKLVDENKSLKEVKENVEIPVKWFRKERGHLMLVKNVESFIKEDETNKPYLIFSNTFKTSRQEIIKEKFTYSELNVMNKSFTEKLDFYL